MKQKVYYHFFPISLINIKHKFYHLFFPTKWITVKQKVDHLFFPIGVMNIKEKVYHHFFPISLIDMKQKVYHLFLPTSLINIKQKVYLYFFLISLNYMKQKVYLLLFPLSLIYMKLKVYSLLSSFLFNKSYLYEIPSLFSVSMIYTKLNVYKLFFFINIIHINPSLSTISSLKKNDLAALFSINLIKFDIYETKDWQSLHLINLICTKHKVCSGFSVWFICNLMFTISFFFNIDLGLFWLMLVSWKIVFLLTLVLLNPDIPCLCKQCRSRSVGFWRSQLIWICTVCH